MEALKSPRMKGKFKGISVVNWKASGIAVDYIKFSNDKVEKRSIEAGTDELVSTKVAPECPTKDE